MRRNSGIRRLLPILWAVFGLACDDGSAAQGSGAECGDEGLVVTGVVREFTPGLERQEFPVLEGVEVCVFEHDEVPCVQTNASGVYSLCNVPADSDLMISFDKEGRVPSLRMLATRAEDYDVLAETVLGTYEEGQRQADIYGVDWMGIEGGGIQFFGASPGDGVLQVALLGGYSVELKNPDGSPAMCPAEDGEVPCAPLFLGDTGLLDLELTESSRVGVGAFGNIPPGDYELFFSHSDLVCNERLPESGWRSESDNAVRVKVVPDWVTVQVGMFCQPGI